MIKQKKNSVLETTHANWNTLQFIFFVNYLKKFYSKCKKMPNAQPKYVNIESKKGAGAKQNKRENWKSIDGKGKSIKRNKK